MDGTTFSVTYAELATKLGITVPSAKNLCRRKKWARAPGNDGATRISIPKDYLDEAAASANAGARTGTKTGTSTSIDAPGALATIERLSRQIEHLQSRNNVLASMPEQVAALEAAVKALTEERDWLRDRTLWQVVRGKKRAG